MSATPTTTSAAPQEVKKLKGKFDRRLFMKSGLRGMLGAGVLFTIFFIVATPNARMMESMDAMNHLMQEQAKRNQKSS